ncbi:MAG TPA: cyclopropane fatty acyl phospholipid synthase [Azonexus sp.]
MQPRQIPAPDKALPPASAPPRARPELLHDLAVEAGFRFNGDDPWDIAVADPRFYRRVAVQGSLGLGEAYMDGWWECPRLDQLFHRLLSIDADRRIERWMHLRLLGAMARRVLFNPQSKSRAFMVGEHHYDIGNDVFEAMLDSTMSYSCAYWARARSLDEAQRHKLDLICRKLELRPGERLLDIGCGWGGLARFAAERYGVEVLGITVSREQQQLALARCAGLPVRIELIDYRDLTGHFDKVVSVGMFEHVGPRNHARFFAVVHRVLEDEGLLLLQTIGHHVATRQVDPWVNKYVFPNGHLPSAAEIAGVVEGRFLIEDWHNCGPDYDRTLMAWWDNFERAWPALRGKYGERFFRMWKYYLLSCAGFFRARQGQLWQLVMSKRIRSAVYRSVR